MASRNPIADLVNTDDLGPSCAKCYGPVYADKITANSKSVKIRWRHVESHPMCLDPNYHLDMSRIRG